MSNKYLNDTGLLYFFNKLKTIFLTNVAYDSTNKKITKTLNGATSDVVTVATIKSDLNLSKSDVGLGNVDNTADANKAVASAGKLTSKVNVEGIKFDGSAAVSYYAECPTAAATAAKVATITPATSDFALATGARVIVKFTYANTAASSTLNVNGTGAKAIYYNGAAIGKSVTDANGTYEFVYNGTQWELIGDLDTNTTYTNAGLGQGYGTCNTAADTVDKVATLSSYALVTGGVVAVKFDYSVPANATLNINSKGAKQIFYKAGRISDNVIFGGDIATFMYDGTQYNLLSIDRVGAERLTFGVHVETDGSNNIVERGLSIMGRTTNEEYGFVPFIGVSGDYHYLEADEDGMGFMTAADKIKLNGITVFTAPTALAQGTSGLVPVPAATPQMSEMILTAKRGWQTPTIVFTTTPITNGKNVVLQLAFGDYDEDLTVLTIDSALSSSSENPVQNKVINTALGNKAPLASPALTGTPTAPTATAGTNTTQIATTAFVKTALDNALAGVTSISYSVVQTLPATGSAGVIYLVAHSHGTGDIYDEYIWTGSAFEKIGTTDIDLSGYMLTTDMVAITTAEIDTLFA